MSSQRTTQSQKTPDFTHLHVHTHYSLLDGLSKIDELLDYVKEKNMDSIAITDHGNLYGAIEFYKAAKKRDIKPIIGLEGYTTTNMHVKGTEADDKRYYHLILLAKNNTGYKNLIALTTKAHLEGFYYKPRFDRNLLREHSEGLIALSGCLGAEIPQLIQNNNTEKAKKVIREYKEIFGENNFYLEMQSHPNLEEQKTVNEKLYQLSKETNTPVVATQDSHYTRPEDADAHDVLLAIQTGNQVDDENRLSLKDEDFSVKPPKKMVKEFKDYPEAIENTQKIKEKCNIEINLGEYQLPHFEVPKEYQNADEYLTKLCIDGLNKRYGIDGSKISDLNKPIAGQMPNPEDEKQKQIGERLDYELSVIKNTGFASYFLIVQDFVNWAKNKGIAVGPGRGSAAGSIVSYLINVTNIDPLEFNLLFERFLNPERISMPDIDIDFADHRRDEVLHYAINKYGEDKVAQIITFGTMAARAAIRDAGRALGYSYGYCDKVAKLIPMTHTLQQSLDEIQELKDLYDSDADSKRLIDSAQRLEGVVRHASVHACGVVITKDPLIEHVPLQHPVQDETSTVTQYEMHAVEDLGLLKMDFLGLKNLTIIENALDIIKKRHGDNIDIENIPLDDKKVYEMLSAAETTGVFQLESSGMRRYLKELQPSGLEDVIAMISLYRPGPMDLIPEFLERKQGKKEIKYLHPKLEPILKNTYGIAVYQEQVLEIARELAGFTYGEADVLRKAIGKKIKELLDEQKEKWINGILENGIDKKTAQKLWEFVEPFARYGFNRAHATCYARIAYETAYLKAHYPTDFFAALLNAEQKNIDRLSFVVEEAKRGGIELLPPSINESKDDFTVIESGENKRTIRFGLAAVKNVGSNAVQQILEERKKNGKYTSLENLLERVTAQDFNKKSIEALIKAGALDEFGERNQLLENIENLLQYAKEYRATQNAGQFSLFGGSSLEEENPSGISLREAEPISEKQRLDWEKELLGFYITSHPLESHANKLKGLPSVARVMQFAGRTHPPMKVGAIISNAKKILTKKGQPMMFLSLEDLTESMEAIVFPSLYEKKQNILEEGKVVITEGRLNTREGETKFICEDISELS